MRRIAAVVSLAGLLCFPSIASAQSSAKADIRISSSPNEAVRIIAPAAGIRVTVGHGTRRGDTLTIRTPARLEASLAANDLRVEAVGSAPITVEAKLTNAPALRLSGAGRVVLLKAGGGAVQVPR